MQQVPTIAILKNGSLSLYKDFSYLDYERKGKKEALNQYNNSVYKDAIKQLNKYDRIPQKFNNVKEYVKSFEQLHHLHALKSEMQGINIKPLGVMSQNQIKQCRKAVENVINFVFFNYDKSLSWTEQRFITFVTLTLPAPQLHSDRVFRKMQTRFLENMTKTYNVDFYVWKAETQENGNIHFHILLDRYVDKDDISKLWNAQLDKYGYIDRFEDKHGHRNPPTTEIHGLVKVKNTVSYIMKYMTKLEDGKRPVIGQLWGCSNSVKKLDYPKFCGMDNDFREILKLIELEEVEQLFSDDYVSYYVGNMFSLVRLRFGNLWKSVKQYYKNLLNPRKNEVFEPPKIDETDIYTSNLEDYQMSLQLNLPF